MIMTRDERLTHELAYEEAVGFLKTLLAGPECGPIGYVASSVDVDNYKRLFTRDTVWMGLAAILSGDEELIGGFRSSLEVLAGTQREDGAIPSNVSPGGEVSYGIIAPRVDATTLYIIGCADYCRYRNDEDAVRHFYPSVERAIKYLEDTWENKSCGLLYIPRAGNWADEYLQQGFVLYDEMLWHIAQKKYAGILKAMKDERASVYMKKAKRTKKLIREKFWIKNSHTKKDAIYLSMRKKIDLARTGYLMHFFYATGPNDENCFVQSHGIFDAFGNSLAILEGIATEAQTKKILLFVDEISENRYPLIPAHYPFFRESVFRSKKLHQYRFKQYIGHYHNGGLWPWYTGIYAAALVKIGERERALKFLDGILLANNEKRDGMNYYEYHSGEKGVARMKVAHPRGLDLYFSETLADLVNSQKPTVVLRHKGEVVRAHEYMCVRDHCIIEGDTVELIAMGPDADEVLSAIAAMKDKEGTRYFGNVEISSIESEPGGTPYLGVSAAAYIIAYKAYKEGKILFAE
jgi:phosphotransferase system HPr-like phosphotransfer protein